LTYALLSKGVAVIRPQIFTFLLFAVLLLLLKVAEGGRLSALWAVPAVFALWVNLHGGFLAGLGILLVWIAACITRSLKDGRPRRAEIAFVAAGIAALGATLLNPYGMRLLTFLVRPATVVRSEISEWQPIAIVSTYGVTYLFFVTIAVTALAYTRRSRQFTTLVAFICLALAPLLATRHASLLALGAPLLLAEHIGDSWDRLSPRQAAQRTPWALAAIAAVVAVTLLWAALPRFRCIRIDPAVAIGYPARATATLRESGVTGNLATPFNWGEYTIWYLGPRVKVSVDGRRETVYSTAVLGENLRFATGLGNWDTLLDDRTDLVLTDRGEAAFNLMKLYPGWVSVHEDSVAAIFVREGSPMVARIVDTRVPALPADGAGLCFP